MSAREPPSDALPAPLESAFARLVPEAGPIIDAQALAGGFRNRSFRLETARGQWFARWQPPEATPGLAAFATEVQIARCAASAGLAPSFSGADVSARVLVSEFLGDATPWDTAAARRTQNIERLARLLRALHALAVPASLAPYRPCEIADRYIEGLRSELRASAAPWISELGSLASAHEQRYDAHVLCHNDLVAENILDDGESLWLVDFEYATLSHPILDLAGAAALNRYDSLEQRRLLDAYYAPQSVPFTRAAWGDAMRMVLLLAYVWALCGDRPTETDAAARLRFADGIAGLLRQDGA